MHPRSLSRRACLGWAAAGVGAALMGRIGETAAFVGDEAQRPPTEFQIACMTLPYSRFPLERALVGIKTAGFRYVAWGVTHKEAEGERHVVDRDAPPARAKELAGRCRDMGLEPVMMFSEVYPEHDGAVEVLTHRLKQAAAAGIGQVLTFGHTEGGNAKIWLERLRRLAPIAQDHNVILVVKQHGGETGTGEACAKITREINHPFIKVNYDAGNVMDYLDVDPLPDIERCADEVRSFCIKDHRNTPRDEDCGPGFGEIDHYRLLGTVAFTGRTMPLCCENIFAPLLPRPNDPQGVDDLARRAREFLETVTAGLHATR